MLYFSIWAVSLLTINLSANGLFFKKFTSIGKYKVFKSVQKPVLKLN